jgi:integrase
MKDAGLPKGTRIHDLRSAVATAVAERAGVKVAQRLLGHHDARTTLRYIRSSVESERAALESFAGAVALLRLAGARR